MTKDEHARIHARFEQTLATAKEHSWDSAGLLLPVLVSIAVDEIEATLERNNVLMILSQRNEEAARADKAEEALKALQPKRTGRLPDVGRRLVVVDAETGYERDAVVTERDHVGRSFLADCSPSNDPRRDVVRRCLQAEGITWRWPDEEKGAK